MKFLQTLVIQEKTGLKVDQPDSSGGTTSTGNVARKAFSDETSFLECVLSTIAVSHRPALAKIHTQLAAILRVYNSGRKVNTVELGKVCKDTYLLILDSFPLASITPTLHKLSNSGFGLKEISEEGTEACNKLVRKYRETSARKDSFETNIVDIFVRLASQSDPVSVSYRRCLICE